MEYTLKDSYTPKEVWFVKTKLFGAFARCSQFYDHFLPSDADILFGRVSMDELIKQPAVMRFINAGYDVYLDQDIIIFIKLQNLRRLENEIKELTKDKKPLSWLSFLFKNKL